MTSLQNLNHCCDTQAICKLRYNNTCKLPTTKTLAKVWKTCPAGKSINTALFLYNISVDHLITINITELLKSKNQNVIMRKILLNLFKKKPQKTIDYEDENFNNVTEDEPDATFV